MEKINFVNGTTINGAETFNEIQDNVEKVFNGEEAMGDIVVDGINSKNLFNFNNMRVPYATVDYTNKTITFTSFNTNTNYLKEICPNLVVGETYTLSFVTTSSVKYIYLSETQFTWNIGEAHTITQGDLDSYILFYGSEDTQHTISNIQIEKGTTATEYKPYIEFKDDITEYTLTNTPEHSAGTNTISLEKSRKTVIFNSLIWFNSLTANTWMTIGTITANLRPKKELTTIGILKDGNGNIKNYGQILVKTNGEVQVKSLTGYSSLTNVAFSLSWFV